METFKNTEGKPILLKMVQVIQENKDYLGQVDGEIGDGDHGANMNKGFTLFEKKYREQDFGFTEGLELLGNVLLNEIGGSMGPIYGTIFLSMCEAGEDFAEIGLDEFLAMLTHARQELFQIVDAREGDKTLVDCLSPAVEALAAALKGKKEIQRRPGGDVRGSPEWKGANQKPYCEIWKSLPAGTAFRGSFGRRGSVMLPFAGGDGQWDRGTIVKQGSGIR